MQGRFPYEPREDENLKTLILHTLITAALITHPPCIINFGKPLCEKIQITSRVIVKSSLSKDSLSKKLGKPLQQIAFMREANLFLVQSEDPINCAKNLSKKEYIIYAQPDIIQKKIKASLFQNITLESKKLKTLWQKTKGQGVRIAIIDDGFNLGHEDLKKTRLLFSYDVDNKRLDSSPKLSIDTHGTPVAGIIFAQHNAMGIDGIAPNASLIAIRHTQNRTSDTVLAFTVAKKAGADIINCSWNSPMLMEPVFDVITDIAKYGRKGKGAAVVFAAGNEGKEILPYSIEASIPAVITVGTKRSNYGKMLDFTIKKDTIMSTRYDGSYGVFSGSSATAPIISGLLALKFSEDPNLTVKEAVQILKKEFHAKQERREKQPANN